MSVFLLVIFIIIALRIRGLLNLLSLFLILFLINLLLFRLFVLGLLSLNLKHTLDGLLATRSWGSWLFACQNLRAFTLFELHSLLKLFKILLEFPLSDPLNVA